LSPHQQAVQLFCDRGSLEGAIKTIIGTKTDLVFLYMKFLLNSTCLMIHSGIIIVYTYGILPPSSAEATVGYGGGEIVLHSIQWQAAEWQLVINHDQLPWQMLPAMQIIKNLA
jgi:hypothetical protein